MRICSVNVHSLNYTAAATLLDTEPEKWNIQTAGLQEICWPGSGETKVGNTIFLWSGEQDGSYQEGVAQAVSNKLMSTCVAWTPVNEKLHECFRHSIDILSVTAAHAPTEAAPRHVNKHFYAQLESVISISGRMTYFLYWVTSMS